MSVVLKYGVIFRQQPGQEIKMRLLVGYNGSIGAEAALQAAQKHANAFDGVTSLEQGPTLDKLDIERAESELEYLRTPFNIVGFFWIIDIDFD
jgi:hypothetical protein